jgi:hypothetical protein
VLPKQVKELKKKLGPVPLPAEVQAFVTEMETASTKPHLSNAEQAFQLYQAISAANKNTYAAGLRYIVGEVADLKLKVTMAEMALRAGTTNNHEHLGNVSQAYTSNPGQDIAWTVYLDMKLMSREPNVLTVGTNIFLIDNNAGVNDEDRRAWKTHIGQAWSNTHCFEGTIQGAKRSWALRFELNFVNNTTPANKRYDVTVHPAPAPALATFGQDFLNRAATVAGVAERREVTDHRHQHTLDLGNWGKGDNVAVVHEFGHMLGCPDEYDLHSFNGGAHGVAYDASWNQSGYATDSIMNNPMSEAKIYPRHLDYVRHVFEAWQGFPRDSLAAVARTSYMHL